MKVRGRCSSTLYTTSAQLFDRGRGSEDIVRDPKSWATGDKAEGEMLLETTPYTGAAVRYDKTRGNILYDTD